MENGSPECVAKHPIAWTISIGQSMLRNVVIQQNRIKGKLTWTRQGFCMFYNLLLGSLFVLEQLIRNIVLCSNILLWYPYFYCFSFIIFASKPVQHFYVMLICVFLHIAYLDKACRYLCGICIKFVQFISMAEETFLFWGILWLNYAPKFVKHSFHNSHSIFSPFSQRRRKYQCVVY